MAKKWNREATSRLLRYGRKNEGGWTDAECFGGEAFGFLRAETIPDDNDVDLVISAPMLLEALEESVKSMVALQSNVKHAEKSGATRWEGVSEALQPFIDKARAAIKAAKGESDD